MKFKDIPANHYIKFANCTWHILNDQNILNMNESILDNHRFSPDEEIDERCIFSSEDSLAHNQCIGFGTYNVPVIVKFTYSSTFNSRKDADKFCKNRNWGLPSGSLIEVIVDSENISKID